MDDLRLRIFEEKKWEKEWQSSRFSRSVLLLSPDAEWRSSLTTFQRLRGSSRLSCNLSRKWFLRDSLITVLAERQARRYCWRSVSFLDDTQRRWRRRCSLFAAMASTDSHFRVEFGGRRWRLRTGARTSSVLFSNGKQCICTVIVGLYHYTHIMIPFFLHSNFNTSTIQHPISIYYSRVVISSSLHIK